MSISLPTMIPIPAGMFIMGSIPLDGSEQYTDELPIHPLYLADYSISETLITNRQYAEFVEQADYPPPDNWNRSRPPLGKSEHPVVNVSWYDASAYCNWLRQVTSLDYRLPTEAEWEKAARGPHANTYPWGYEWRENLCNTREMGHGETTAVGFLQGDISYYGLLDTGGNASEWTLTLWGGNFSRPDFAYPYVFDDGRENLTARANSYRIVRGGAFSRSQQYARCAWRGKISADRRNLDLGFRVALEIRG